MSERLKVFILLLGDIFLLLLSLFITIQIKGLFGKLGYDFQSHLTPFSLIFLGWITVYFIEGLYTVRSQSPTRMVAHIARSTTLNVILSFVIFYMVPNFQISPKSNLIILGAIAFFSITFWRRFLLNFFSWTRFEVKIHTICNEKNKNEVESILEDKPHLGYKITRHFNLHEIHNIKLDIPRLIKENIKVIVIDRNALRNEDTLNKVFQVLSHNIKVIDLSNFIERISGEIPIDAIEKSWFLEYCGYNQSKFYEVSKTILDKSSAIFIFLIVCPIFIPLLFLLLVISGRPLFFKQKRVGHFNKEFTLLKLRTMVNDAEKNGAKWATPNDSRITPIGKFLRKSRLDEIPQLWNVIRGDMSLVGPRPERPEFTTKLSESIPYYNERHLVKPGVTGWAQINFRYGYSEDDSAKKLRFDLYYIKNKSIWMDIAIILKTAKTVLTGMGH